MDLICLCFSILVDVHVFAGFNSLHCVLLEFNMSVNVGICKNVYLHIVLMCYIHMYRFSFDSGFPRTAF